LGFEDHFYMALREGDAVAREEAFSKLRPQLLRGIAPKLKAMFKVDDSFIEDVVQETLIIVMRKLSSFRGESAFYTWVCAIAVRVAMAEIRRKRWSDYSLDSLNSDEIFEGPTAPGDFTERVVAKEVLDAVRQSINTALTNKQRTALLAEIEGMTADEIARRYDTTCGAVYKLTHDARRALIKDLHKKGFDLEAALAKTT
jgi:RNA polymerase sigma-70 factor, ECF subfamily